MEASAARRPTRPAHRVPATLLRLASDDRLVELVRGGSEPAFEVVYDRHHRGILAFSRHMVGTQEEAEDAVQHTFMAAYREIRGTAKHIQLRPWLYTIARNRCLSVLRARRERPLGDADEPATEHLAAVVQRRQDLRDLLRDLHELPEGQRAALVLAEAGGVSHDEIAQILDVPREKVKALVFQARSSLIASKEARETSCEAIREQLAELKGGALRRNTLRRHLKECPGCREFRTALQTQRRLLAVALPVVPSLALKQAVLGGTIGTGTAAAGVAGGGAAAGVAGGSLAGGGSALTAKVLVVAAVAGGGATAAGVKSVVQDPPARPAPAIAPADAGAPGSDHRPAPDATGSGPQPSGSSSPVGVPADRPAAGSKRGAGGKGGPVTRVRRDDAPGLAKGEGDGAKPDAPPGRAGELPAAVETPMGEVQKVNKEKVAEPEGTRPGKPVDDAPKGRPEALPLPEKAPPELLRPTEGTPAPAPAPVPVPEEAAGVPLPDLVPADGKAGKGAVVGKAEQ
ncbi:MAG TPA: RNA polymerase sigma factor [Solirubrobacteraceae bacterium]|nr:RNA polymerase sigma factor [Solirubrobacteraceae bacterium]